MSCLIAAPEVTNTGPGFNRASLETDLTRNTRAPHFTPQHWLLRHMGLYKFEFNRGRWSIIAEPHTLYLGAARRERQAQAQPPVI